jgi:hypothetical protein
MLVRHRARENRPTLAGRRVVEAAGLEPASASAPSARFYERSSRSSFACLDGPGRRRGASPLIVPPAPRARTRKVSPLADTGNRAVGRPDRWAPLFKQREPAPQSECRVCLGAGVLRVSSKLGSSRRTQTAHVETGRPHAMYSNTLQGVIKRRKPLGSAPEALFHGALHLALGGTAGDLAALVVLALAAGDGKLELDVAVPVVEPEWDEGLAVLLALACEAGDLATVQQQLAVAGGVLGDVGGVPVGRDVGAEEEDLPVAHPRVALLQVRPARAHGLDFGAGKRDARLVGLIDVEVVKGFPVAREVRHRRFTTLSSARCMSGRTSSSSTRILSPTL